MSETLINRKTIFAGAVGAGVGIALYFAAPRICEGAENAWLNAEEQVNSIAQQISNIGKPNYDFER